MVASAAVFLNSLTVQKGSLVAVKARYVPKVMVSSELRMTGPPQQALQSSWSSQGSDLHSQKRSYEATRAAERMTHRSDRAYAGPQDSLR